MKINIIAIGKIKEKYYSEAIAEYIKRCTRYADVRVIELCDAPQGKSPEEQKRLESALLMEKAKGYVIAMDGRGEEFSSTEMARLLKQKEDSGEREISFLIGGSHGHTEELCGYANKVISFGKITLPHQLFRVVLSEQIYRALAINAGLPYHK